MIIWEAIYRMKSNLTRVRIIRTIGVIIVTLIIAVLSNWFRESAIQAVINSTLSEMQKIGRQQEYALETEIKEAQSDITLIAEYLADADVSEENVLDLFNMQSHVEKFDFLYYVDLDGNGISSDGESYDFSTSEAFSTALENEFFVTIPEISFELNRIAFGVSVPIVQDNEVSAILFGEVSMEEFFRDYQAETDGKGDVFLVDTDLNFVFSTSDGHTGHATIPEGDISEMGIDNVTQAQDDILNGSSGGFYYDYYGISKVMVYMPIYHTQWALAINVESEVISSEIEVAVNQLNTICIITYWFLIILICYTSFYHLHSIKKLEKNAFYDSLTGLPNLPKFKILAAEMMNRYPYSKFTMQKMDIEKFQAINEVYGFESGNLVLSKIAETVNEINEKTYICARVGADEFLMFAGDGFLDGGDKTRDEYEKKFKDLPPELSNHEFNFRYGRYFLEPGERDITDIINKTSLAHNMAKKNPSRKTWDYDDAFRKEIRQNVEITNKKKNAILNEEFKVFLQPKFAINDDSLVGAEALVRWIEADGNMIFPNDFIPLFEKDGFIVELDRYVLEHTCMTIRKWMDEGLNGIPISVNLSRVNLSNPNIVDDIVRITDKHNVPHEYIEIELTESASSEEKGALETLYQKLQSKGFKTSIDDFGAGYSSLAMLKSLNVNTLKMDRSFFLGESDSRRDNMLIDGIIKLSHSLGMFVVAEGIETAEQVQLLRTMNCDAVQGYFYDRPMSVSMFEEKYASVMKKSYSSEHLSVPIINHINDTRFASTFVPCGILITEIDDSFTIVEANEGYFDLIEYSPIEMRDLFNNKGLSTLHPDDIGRALDYFNTQVTNNKSNQFDFTCRINSKISGVKVVHFGGKIATNELGISRLYFSLIDITSYTETVEKLQKEREFNSMIAYLTNSTFFDYNLESNTIRFSRTFADKFNIPDIIENFTETELCNEMFPKYKAILDSGSDKLPHRGEGEFCIELPNGDPIWYIYSCKYVYDDAKNRVRIVGKMSEAIGHKLEMDILKIKSVTDPSISIYDKNATERYIHNYLRVAAADFDNGAFFIINLENFEKIEDTFGHDYAKNCLKEVGDILRNMFRSSDIIGRMEKREFYVFINNSISAEYAELKANDLRKSLSKTYEKDGVSLHVVASVGISLYPDHGIDFKTLYEKAKSELEFI